MEDQFEVILEQLSEQVEQMSKDDRKLFDSAVDEVLSVVRAYDITPAAAGTVALAYVSIRGAVECDCPACELKRASSGTTH